MQLGELLSRDEVLKIHDASLQILEEVGLLVRNYKAKAIFKRHGCVGDAESETVKFPRAVDENYRKAFPPKFTFYARDPKYDKTLPDARPVIITGSSAPNMLDPVTRKERRSFSDDIARIARVINELPGYDVFSISTLAEDAPLDRFRSHASIRRFTTVSNRFASVRRIRTTHNKSCNWRLSACGAPPEPA